MNFPYSIIDLTHDLSSLSPSWDGACGFQCHNVIDYQDCGINLPFRVQRLNMQAGIGTHLDAPAHCVEGGKTVAELDLNDLLAPAVVINVSQKANSEYKIVREDIINFETKYGQIKTHSFVIIYTGWDRYWQEPEKYHNNYKFPFLAQEAAELLLARKVVGLGTDTLSPDRPDTGYPVHKLFLEAGKYLIENVANAAKLPAVGSYILALPLKILQGTEAPLRLVALMNKEEK
ncbi:cyclase family protein [Legionella tunisiensis]|uniref:cyclase family protein n=1 Tax=Legionella tunisiensis TaxID=1034944 RepID=UPI0002E5D72D|nr:cyclase family protein [Legionella tunisiensis]